MKRVVSILLITLILISFAPSHSATSARSCSAAGDASVAVSYTHLTLPTKA